jgi:uncharacterized protein (TIGR00156 family)
MKMMRIIGAGCVVVLAVVVCIVGSASAQFTGPGGGGSVTSVEDFRKQCDLKTSGGGLSGLISSAAEGAKCDEMKFTLEGNIVSQVDGDLYEFKDETGSVNVEINDFDGVKVGPEDKVRLHGEADYEEVGLILEVDKLELAK